MSLVALTVGVSLLGAAAHAASTGAAAGQKRGGTRRLGLPVNIDLDPARAWIDAAGRLRGAAARRTAWAELDVDLMRNNPPWAPSLHRTGRIFVSRSFGCFLYHSLYGVDLTAACKN